jgi:hypothetical protein
VLGASSGKRGSGAAREPGSKRTRGAAVAGQGVSPPAVRKSSHQGGLSLEGSDEEVEEEEDSDSDAAAGRRKKRQRVGFGGKRAAARTK